MTAAAETKVRDPQTGRFLKAPKTRDRDAGPVLQVPQLARNAADVPGGVGCPPPAKPVHAGGRWWTADDADPWGSPIGTALAIEWAAREPS